MNLIICNTPLQVLIAERIVALHPHQDFFGLMIAPIYNEKYRYYFERLSKFCKKKYLIINNNYSKVSIYYQIIRLKFLFKKESFNNIFFANINDSIIQSIASRFYWANIYTFDDGTINIFGNKFGTSKNESSLKKMIRIIFGIVEDIDSLKVRSSQHYTIYPEFDNIIKNTVPITLFEKKIDKPISKKNTIKIMLGQPIFLDNIDNQEITQKIIDEYKIDFYFPHPRESYQVERVKYVHTPMIFEDYFLNGLSDDCIIYTYASTVVFNILGCDAQIVSFRPKIIDEKEVVNRLALLECYDYLSKINIDIVEI